MVIFFHLATSNPGLGILAWFYHFFLAIFGLLYWGLQRKQWILILCCRHPYLCFKCLCTCHPLFGATLTRFEPAAAMSQRYQNPPKVSSIDSESCTQAALKRQWGHVCVSGWRFGWHDARLEREMACPQTLDCPCPLLPFCQSADWTTSVSIMITSLYPSFCPTALSLNILCIRACDTKSAETNWDSYPPTTLGAAYISNVVTDRVGEPMGIRIFQKYCNFTLGVR